MIVTVFIFTTQLITFMFFNNKYRKNIACYYAFSTLYFILTTIILLIANGGIGQLNLLTVILGASFGIIFVFTINFNVTAMCSGPIGFTSLIFSLNFLLPMFAGLLFYNENLSIIQIVGFILLLITFYIGSQASDNNSKKMTIKWLMFALLAFICGGILNTLIKVHQAMYPGEYMISFLVIGFLSAGIVAGILTVIRKVKKNEELKSMMKKNVIWLVLAAGLTTSLGNYLVVFLSSKIDAVVLFPVYNGGQVVLMNIVSVVLFKEKLNKRSILSIILGLLAICFISL